MNYPYTAIPSSDIPRAADPTFQHLLDTYVSETNKVASVWREFRDSDLDFKAHARFRSVGEILRHQLLSERRFFGEFLGAPEPAADKVLPDVFNLDSALHRFVELARARLRFLADHDAAWWMEETAFFDVKRQRIWIFWRRVLHTAHHRTQLTVVLRLLNRNVPSTYGTTSDVTWTGADPTDSPAAAERS